MRRWRGRKVRKCQSAKCAICSASRNGDRGRLVVRRARCRAARALLARSRRPCPLHVLSEQATRPDFRAAARHDLHAQMANRRFAAFFSAFKRQPRFSSRRLSSTFPKTCAVTLTVCHPNSHYFSTTKILETSIRRILASMRSLAAIRTRIFHSLQASRLYAVNRLSANIFLGSRNCIGEAREAAATNSRENFRSKIRHDGGKNGSFRFFRRYRIEPTISLFKNMPLPEIVLKPARGVPIRIYKRRFEHE